MPKFFAKTNKQEVPTRLLVLQGIIVSFFCLAFVLMPSINAFYWFLTCLSTELYMIMYLLLFLAALKIGRPKEVYSYHMPKGTRYLACFLGIFGAILTIVVGCFPPTGIDVGSPLRYAQLIIFGNLISIAPVFLLWRHKKRSGGR